MIDLLNEIFNPKVGGVFCYIFLISLIVLTVVVIGAYHIISEKDIEFNNERESIKIMECNKLGDMILKQEISYRNEDFALDHWVIRCK